jgi:dienelactone hydrolase
MSRRPHPVAAVAILAGVLLLTAGAAAPASAEIVTETVLYEHDGVVLEGYLAYDDAVTGRRPGVLVVHQWMGLTENERMRARMLASMGYVALACDVYGQGVRPQNRGEAQAEAGKYYGDRALFRGRLQAGLAELAAHELVDPARCAAIGYCFGGGGVLELARDGADVAGVVSFHGSLDTPLPAQEGEVRAKVLVCHGAVDPYVPMAQVEGFVQEMEAAGVDYQLVMYADAVHAFTQKEAGDDPSTGAAYQAAADRRSWEHLRVFFAELFD